MGKGQKLSEREIGQILALKSIRKISHREISRRVGRSHQVINNFLSDPENYGKKKSPGRPEVLSSRDKSKILRCASNSLASPAVLTSRAGVTCHPNTVRNYLKAAPHLKRQKIQRKPQLTEKHKTARLNFARENLSRGEGWKKIIFTDEKKFNLDGPDGFQYYWHDLRKEEVILSRRQMGGGSVMVWAGIGFKNRTKIEFCSKNMNSEEYQDILKKHILNKGGNLAGPGWIFQQDNASIHSSKSTKQWFVTKKIRVLGWPAKSPDLNIIENLWGTLSRKVYAEGRQYQTVEELKSAIVKHWGEITKEEVHNLYQSLESRIFELITKHGGCTHY